MIYDVEVWYYDTTPIRFYGGSAKFLLRYTLLTIKIKFYKNLYL